MKIYDCKCSECKAEFQAVMDKPEEKISCPACESDKVKVTETDMEFHGCSGGCGSCGGCATE